MRKRITKIICAAVAVISAATLAFAPACGTKWSGVKEKDTSEHVSSNGGFLVETDGYVYFINGKTSNTDSNKFGSVLKGSVQRLKKSDIAANNYTSSETVVPSVLYSGSYKAGLYIYDGYIYYTTPSTQKNTSGEVLNSNLDFKRTKLDGTGTTDGYIWQSSDNSVDYRYVNVGGTVYMLYARNESLYGTSATNIHAVNCSTKKNTILAYNVASYAFDTVDAENPYVFYTMNVPQFLDGSGSNYSYNQLYVVRADAKESPRDYKLAEEIDDYDASKDPVYINFGDYVFDGIGKVDYESGRVGKLNYAYYNGRTHESGKGYELNNAPYTYEIKWYKDGVLYFNRKDTRSSNSLYCLTVDGLVGSNGRVDYSKWDPVEKNGEKPAFISKEITTDYTYIEMSVGGEEEATYALNMSSSGITRSKVKDGKLSEEVTMTSDSSATVIEIKEELNHTCLYYTVSGSRGRKVKRLVIDGSEDDYGMYPPDDAEDDVTYDSVTMLDVEVSSDWYAPEFVGNKLFYPSADEGVSDYGYISVVDFADKDGKVMTNKQIEDLNEKFDAVAEKIGEYDDKKNADDTPAYAGLSSALNYLYNTGDVEYIDKLIKAYVDIEGRDEEYIYSKASVAIYKDYAKAEGDWADYKEDYKTVNGKTVYANSRYYYYTLVGKMTESDSKAVTEYFRSADMKSYPVDNSTWWQKLSTGEKVGFIIGMVACGLLVIGGVTVLVIFLVKHFKKNNGEEVEEKVKVDITDDKDIDVYGGEGEESSQKDGE